MKEQKEIDFIRKLNILQIRNKKYTPPNVVWARVKRFSQEDYIEMGQLLINMFELNNCKQRPYSTIFVQYSVQFYILKVTIFIEHTLYIIGEV